MTVHPTRPTGIRARIPKGTRITGTFPGSAKSAGRTHDVDVWQIYNGYLPDAYDVRKGHRGCPAEIVWVGAHGYWHHAALEDVSFPVGADRVAAVHGTRYPVVTRADIETHVATLAASADVW